MVEGRKLAAEPEKIDGAVDSRLKNFDCEWAQRVGSMTLVEKNNSSRSGQDGCVRS